MSLYRVEWLELPVGTPVPRGSGGWAGATSRVVIVEDVKKAVELMNTIKTNRLCKFLRMERV